MRLKKELLSIGLIVVVLLVAMFPIHSAFAATYGPYYVNIYPGQDSVMTYPVYFGEGTMHVTVENKGPHTISYYVLFECPYYECPALTSGVVQPGKYVSYPKQHSAGKFIFKIVNDYGDSEGHGKIEQF